MHVYIEDLAFFLKVFFFHFARENLSFWLTVHEIKITQAIRNYYFYKPLYDWDGFSSIIAPFFVKSASKMVSIISLNSCTGFFKKPKIIWKEYPSFSFPRPFWKKKIEKLKIGQLLKKRSIWNGDIFWVCRRNFRPIRTFLWTGCIFCVYGAIVQAYTIWSIRLKIRFQGETLIYIGSSTSLMKNKNKQKIVRV